MNDYVLMSVDNVLQCLMQMMLNELNDVCNKLKYD